MERLVEAEDQARVAGRVRYVCLPQTKEVRDLRTKAQKILDEGRCILCAAEAGEITKDEVPENTMFNVCLICLELKVTIKGKQEGHA